MNRFAIPLLAASLAGMAHGQITPGVSLDFNAHHPASGVDGNTWNSLTADTTLDFTFGADVTLTNVTSAGTLMSRAFRFTGGTGDDNANANSNTWNGLYGEGNATTWEFWIRPDDTGDAYQVILESGGSGTGFGIWYEKGTDSDNSGTIHFTIDGGTGAQIETVSAVIDTSDFRHVVCVYDESGSGAIDVMQIYVDGVMIDDNLSATVGDNASNDNDNTTIDDYCGGDGTGLGNANNSFAEGTPIATTASDAEFDGDIAIFRVYGAKALTGAEILVNYNTPLNAAFAVDAGQDTDADTQWEDVSGGPTAAEFYLDTANGVGRVTATTSATLLTHAYDFPGGFSGDTAPDDAEAGYGGAKLVATGDTGECLSFQDTTAGDWTQQDVSLEIWIKPDNLTPPGGGQVIYEDGGGTGLGLFISSNQLVCAQDTDEVPISYNLSTDPSGLLLGPATSEFIHVVVTRVASGATEMFINGASVGTSTDNDGDWSGGDGFGLGARGESNVGGRGNNDGTNATYLSFDGQIAIFRLYNQLVLSANEADALFQSQLPDTDLLAPVISTTNPADDATNVYIGTDLVANFNENIALTGAGTITVNDITNGTDNRVIQLDGSADDGSAIVTDNLLTISLDSNLTSGTEYGVQISADAVVDLSTDNGGGPNAFPGILDNTTWSFTTATEDLSAPIITILDPLDNATETATTATLSVTFDDNIAFGTGNITINRLTAPAATFETFDVTSSSQLSIAGNTLTITPSSAFDEGVEYAVQIDAGAIKNLTDVSFAGIADNTTWSFTTRSIYVWVQTVGGAQSWNTGTNWQAGVAPNPVSGDVIDLSTVNLAANTTLTLEADRTAGLWKFGDNGGNGSTWTVAAGNSMILAGTDPTIQVLTATTLNNVITGSQGVIKSGSGALTLSGTNTFTGGITINSGQVIFSNQAAWGASGSRNVTFANTASMQASTGSSGNVITVNDGATATLTGATLSFSSAAGATTAEIYYGQGSSTLTLGNASAYHGSLRTNAGGNSSYTIQFTSLGDDPGAGNLKFAGGTGDSNQRTRFRLYGDAGPLTFNNRSIEIIPKNVTPSNWSARGSRLDNDNSNVNNIWVINTDIINYTDRDHEFTLWGTNNGNNEIAGAIGNSTASAFYSTQTGKVTLLKEESGKWILSGVNTYTGNTIINDGTLEIRGAGQLGGGNYAGNIINNDASPSPFTFASSANQTISGNISGDMAFIKDGTGTLSLTGNTNHTGNTTVNNGTLSLGNGTNNTDLSDFSTLAVASGALLDLNFASGSPDAVLYLSLGGVTLPAGQYGHTSSGASNGGAGIGAYDAYFADNTGIINNLGGSVASLEVAFWDGGTTDIGAGGNAASSGGAGTWNDSTLNWDVGFTAHAAWFNTLTSTAHFGGTPGEVALGSDINIGRLNIDIPNGNGTPYTIGDAAENNTITFGGEKVVSVIANGNGTRNFHTIRAGIAGSPALNITGANNNSYYFALEPTTNVTMDIGTINMYNSLGSNKQLRLGGQSNGNVADRITWTVTGNQLQLRKQDSTNGGADGSSWTINQNLSLNSGRVYVDEGTLICGGANNFITHITEIQSGGRLVAGGIWNINDNREHFDIKNGGIIAPGNGVGTLTVYWNRNAGETAYVDFNSGSTYEWEVGASATDVIRLEKNSTAPVQLLVAGSTTIKVINSGGAPAGSDQLTVFTYEAGVTTPDTATLNANITIDISGTGYTGTPTLVNDGAGTIYITGLDTPTPYEVWAATFLPDDVSNPAANFDSDAFTNFMEFAFGTDPTVANSGRLTWDGSTLTRGGPAVFQNFEVGGGVTFKARFIRRTDHGASGSASYTWQFSSDLTDWESSADTPPWFVAPTVVTTEGDYQLVEVPYPFFLSTFKKARFFRVEITEVP